MDVKHAPQKLEIPVPSENIKTTTWQVSLLFEQRCYEHWKNLCEFPRFQDIHLTRASFDNKEEHANDTKHLFRFSTIDASRETIEFHIDYNF